MFEKLSQIGNEMSDKTDYSSPKSDCLIYFCKD